MKPTKTCLLCIILLGCLWGCVSCRVEQSVPRHYHTLAQKARTTICLDEHSYTMSCTIQLWRNDLVIISLQPMLGIEVGRIEATSDSVWVFDKMNRRYAVLAYHDAIGHIHPTPSYRMIQDFVSSDLATPSTPVSKQFLSGEHTLRIECAFTTREYNTLAPPKRLDTTKYQRVSLRTILPV